MTTFPLFRYLQLFLLIALPGVLVAACNESGTGGADDDDDVGDDDASDDDVGDDDASGDDDMWADDDDAADDDAADDDAADDDDDAAGDACTVEVGPPGMEIPLSGTCGANAENCEGGYFDEDPTGSCGGGMTCCIDTDQCETVMMSTCAATEDECEGEPPPGAPGFPELGCPPNTPFCCVSGPPR